MLSTSAPVTTDRLRLPMIPHRTCSNTDCDYVHYARGLCQRCYDKAKHGKRLPPFPPRPSFEDKFWAKVDKNGPVPSYAPHLGNCWIWMGAVVGRIPYGRFYNGVQQVSAHRFSYGPIPDGLELDHLCRVPRCVRPTHLEAVTAAENIRRGVAARKLEKQADDQ